MTPAELRTLRDSLGLSGARLGVALGRPVAARTVRDWEAGGHPIAADAAEALVALDRAVSEAADRAAIRVQEEMGGDGPAMPVVLLRYRSDEELERYRPGDLVRLGAHEVHGALVDRLRQRLEAAGCTVRLVWMEPAYEAWRAEHGLDDNEATRAAWAAAQSGERA